MNRRTRKIVKIDEQKCNGCGECVPSCAEGAIQVIDGKARLMADRLCDGLGACLGHCPMDAITIDERPADAFDEAAVEAHLGKRPEHGETEVEPAEGPIVPLGAPIAPAASFSAVKPPAGHGHGTHAGCPGARMRMFQAAGEGAAAATEQASAGAGMRSQLRQWPVQLALLPVQAPLWQDAEILLAADCVPFAYPEFHSQMLAGKTLAIACPKLDEIEPYVTKLAAIFKANRIRSVTIARMEVPCCAGLTRIVHAALEQARCFDVPVHEVVVGIRGEKLN